MYIRTHVHGDQKNKTQFDSSSLSRFQTRERTAFVIILIINDSLSVELDKMCSFPHLTKHGFKRRLGDTKVIKTETIHVRDYW